MDIRDQQPALAVQETVVWLAEHGLFAWPAVAAEALLAGAGHGGDDAGGAVDLSDHCIQPINDIDISVAIYLQGIRLFHGRLSGRAAVAAIARPAGPSHGCDDSGSLVHTADDVIPRFGVKEVARGIKVAHERLGADRLVRRAAVSGIARLAGADIGLNLPWFKWHLANSPWFGWC